MSKRDWWPILGVAVWMVAVGLALVALVLPPAERRHPPEEIMLGEVYQCLDEGRLDEALDKANIMVQRFGDGSSYGFEIYRIRATIHARRGEIEGSICDLTAMIDRLDSDSYQLLQIIRRGRCKEHLGLMQAAADDYRLAYKGYLSRAGAMLNYMDVVDFFWTGRQETDREFGFDQLKYDQTGTYREARRAQREAVLDWMLCFIPVHQEIVANIGDVDAKVTELGSEMHHAGEQAPCGDKQDDH